MKEDKRITQTKQCIEKALIELLNNKYLEEITVKELCEKANINRSTFYTYYTSPNDIYKIIERNAINKIHIFLDSQNISITLYNFFRETINFLYSNQDVFIIMEKEHNALKNAICNFFNKRYMITKQVSMSYLYEFFFFGFINVIKKWLKSNQNETVEELAEYFENLFSPFFSIISD